jgi:Uncharacterized enzyme involved in inositol metabolism
MSLISKVQQPDSHGRIQHVTPESAGWEYVGFDAYLLKKGQTLRLSSGETRAVPGAGGRSGVGENPRRRIPWHR